MRRRGVAAGGGGRDLGRLHHPVWPVPILDSTTGDWTVAAVSAEQADRGERQGKVATGGGGSGGSWGASGGGSGTAASDSAWVSFGDDDGAHPSWLAATHPPCGTAVSDTATLHNIAEGTPTPAAANVSAPSSTPFSTPFSIPASASVSARLSTPVSAPVSSAKPAGPSPPSLVDELLARSLHGLGSR
mmetsp:Transcript_29671/g.94419  ORF Transcript_29671/g.94419 Transcript_29671/m.94419 type:complete len:188 (-) Transcript_29671:247-810(-)